MVHSCSAYGCTNRWSKDSVIKFHKFPLTKPELCQMWKNATKRDEFTPTSNSYICTDHFLQEDYLYSNSTRLKPDAVPSVFNFPAHLQTTKERKRKAPTRRFTPEVANVDTTLQPAKEKKQKTSPTKEELKNVINEKNKKIKVLQQNIRRKDSRLTNLSETLRELKAKQLIDNEDAIKLDENFSGISLSIIQNELNNVNRYPKGYRHNEEVKKFALTLNFYSPRAYEYVRKVFHLPHPNSLCIWTSSVKCEPGFFNDVFDMLQLKVKENPSHADCGLICDAMAIKESVFYNKSTGKYDGYVNYGDGIVLTDENIVATEATVFMLVSFRGQWKYPVGYILDDKVNAKELYSLLTTVLDLSIEHDLKVRTITCDGTSVNLSAMKLFGCKLGKSADEIDGSFYYKGYENPLFYVPDPPHMLKLGRNALGDLGIIVDNDGGLIQWRYIVNLHELQTAEGLKFANKLSDRHLHYSRNKMKVNLAAQTLSSSVADAIEFLMVSGHPDFQHAEATIKFIRIIDRLFDLLNAKNPYAKGYKQALRLSNQHLWKEIISSSISYLKDNLGVTLLCHRRKTFVLGLIVASKSTLQLSNALLTQVPSTFNYILPYKYSQDHLELFFSCIRGKNGWNNNPDVRVFKSAMKRILLKTNIIASKHANCLMFEEESTSSIFSLKWSKNRTSLSNLKDKESDETWQVLDGIPNMSEISPYKENILCYIGGFIANRLMKKMSCVRCSEALVAKKPQLKLYDFTKLRDRGSLVYPSIDIIKILKASEIIFKFFVSGSDFKNPVILNHNKNLKLSLRNKILLELDSGMFESLDLHDLEESEIGTDLHSRQLIKEIINSYLDIRLFRYGQYFTERKLKKNKAGIRQQSNKLVIFKGL